MAFDANKKDLTVAVIGTGTMGRGIVQVSAAGGMHVIAYDEKAGGAASAKEFIGKMFDRSVEKGQMPAAEAKAALDRITVADSLAACAKAEADRHEDAFDRIFFVVLEIILHEVGHRLRARGIGTGGTRDIATRMRPRPAQPQTR